MYPFNKACCDLLCHAEVLYFFLFFFYQTFYFFKWKFSRHSLRYRRAIFQKLFKSIYSITAPFQISMKLSTCPAAGYNNKCQNIMFFFVMNFFYWQKHHILQLNNHLMFTSNYVNTNVHIYIQKEDRFLY